MSSATDTIFTMVRHGQTDANVQGVLQGQADTPLGEMGRAQARAAAERLKHEKFDLFYSSDLSRALETAQIIGKIIGMTPVPLPELREWDLGDLVGLPHEELCARYPDVVRAFRYDSVKDIFVPGGESRDEFFARIASCFDRLCRENPGARILIVTHGGVFRAVYRQIAGLVREGCLLPRPDNAAISRFQNCGGLWQMLTWNETSHLQQTGYTESRMF